MTNRPTLDALAEEPPNIFVQRVRDAFTVADPAPQELLWQDWTRLLTDTEREFGIVVADTRADDRREWIVRWQADPGYLTAEPTHEPTDGDTTRREIPMDALAQALDTHVPYPVVLDESDITHGPDGFTLGPLAIDGLGDAGGETA